MSTAAPWHDPTPRSVRRDPSADPSPAILANLRLILETRPGEALAAPALGAIDFAELVHSDRDALHLLEASLRAAILRHEPRLERVDVTLHADGQLPALGLTIRAHLRPPLRPRRGPLVVRGAISPLGALTLALRDP